MRAFCSVTSDVDLTDARGLAALYRAAFAGPSAGIHFPISVRGSSDAADELQCAMCAVGERSAYRRVHLSSVAAPLFGAPEAVRVAAAAESAAAHS